MATNEELLKQMYKQQTQSQKNQQNPAAATSTDSAPASSAAAPAAGAAQGNTPAAPANGQSTAPRDRHGRYHDGRRRFFRQPNPLGAVPGLSQEAGRL